MVLWKRRPGVCFEQRMKRGDRCSGVGAFFVFVFVFAQRVILGTIQARTHVQLALACQRSMPCAQHRLRLGILVINVLTMVLHLVHLALSLATTLPPRWVRHNFDTSACCDGCTIISEILEGLQHIGTDVTSLPQDGS